MSKEEDNKAVVVRWFTEFWGKEVNLAVIDEIADCYERSQPALVGTVSVEKSEVLSAMLKKKGIPHTVLNAKHHAREAAIVAQAGRS